MPPEAAQFVGELVLNIFLLIVVALGLMLTYRYMRHRSAKNARSETRQAILAEKPDANQGAQENSDWNDL